MPTYYQLMSLSDTFSASLMQKECIGNINLSRIVLSLSDILHMLNHFLQAINTRLNSDLIQKSVDLLRNIKEEEDKNINNGKGMASISEYR